MTVVIAEKTTVSGVFPRFEGVKVASRQHDDVLAVAGRFPGAVATGGSRTKRLDEGADPQRPRELVGQHRDRAVQLELFDRCANREDVEVEDAAESMVGHKQHGGVEGCRLSVELEAVVAADEVDSQMLERKSRCGQRIWSRARLLRTVDVFRDGGEQRVGELFDIGSVLWRHRLRHCRGLQPDRGRCRRACPLGHPPCRGGRLPRGEFEHRCSYRAAAAAAAERARVLIAGPFGLCFLPAFVCLGIVPVVAGLAGDVLQSGLL